MCDIAGDVQSCRNAVRRAWREQCKLGTHEARAFRVCTTLYMLRRPSASLIEARDPIAEWLDMGEDAIRSVINSKDHIIQHGR